MSAAGAKGAIANRTMPNAKNSVGIFTMVLYGIVMLMVLFLMVMGTLVYRSLVEAQNESDAERASLAYVTSAIAASDSINSVGESTDAPEGRALVLKENVDGIVYETRMYLYQGNLVEEYAAATESYNPEQAQRIAHTATFDFTYDSARQIVHISTDAGSQYVALHSAQGVS